MRRIFVALALTAAVVVGTGMVNTHNGPSRSAPQRTIVEGGCWAVGATCATTNSSNTCPPAKATACEMIFQSTEAALVRPVVNELIKFTF